MENKSNLNKNIKAILLGESGVGKTNLINVVAGQNFEENASVSYINSFIEKDFTINKKKYILQLWDTIGQEKYRPLTKIFFKDSKIVIFVYDKSCQKSYEELKYWTEQATEILGDDIIKAIVGNKADLDEDDKDVDENKAREFAKTLNAKFKMTSAKKNIKGFIHLLNELVVDYLKKNNVKINYKKDIISLSTESNKKSKKMANDKEGCC